MGASSALEQAVFAALVATLSLVSRPAAAEKVLANVGGWEVFTDGRAAGFVSFAYGDGYPQADYAPDANGIYHLIDSPQEGGGFRAPSKQNLVLDQTAMGGTTILDQGKINMWRVRSGFISNVFGFGVRNQLTPYTTVTAYVQFWAFVETTDGKRICPITRTRGRDTPSSKVRGAASPPAACERCSHEERPTSMRCTRIVGAWAGRERSTTTDQRWACSDSACSARASRPG
jgi:hypothetical protein